VSSLCHLNHRRIHRDYSTHVDACERLFCLLLPYSPVIQRTRLNFFHCTLKKPSEGERSRIRLIETSKGTDSYSSSTVSLDAASARPILRLPFPFRQRALATSTGSSLFRRSRGTYLTPLLYVPPPRGTLSTGGSLFASKGIVDVVNPVTLNGKYRGGGG